MLPAALSAWLGPTHHGPASRRSHLEALLSGGPRCHPSVCGRSPAPQAKEPAGSLFFLRISQRASQILLLPLLVQPLAAGRSPPPSLSIAPSHARARRWLGVPGARGGGHGAGAGLQPPDGTGGTPAGASGALLLACESLPPRAFRRGPVRVQVLGPEGRKAAAPLPAGLWAAAWPRAAVSTAEPWGHSPGSALLQRGDSTAAALVLFLKKNRCFTEPW